MATFSVFALETIGAPSSVSRQGAVSSTLMLTNNADYAFVSCDLGMTARRRGALGGASPYVNVPVELTLHVIGVTAALCAAALERLVVMVAQARRWENREAVDAVRLRMRLQGGTSDYGCLILGPEDGEAPTSYVVEEEVINGIPRYLVRNVTLRFVRRGLLYKTTSVQATSTATSTKEVGTCTFASSAAVPTPTSLVFGRDSITDTFELPGYVLVGAAGGVARINAATFIGDGSAVVETAQNRSISGSIRRLTTDGSIIGDISGVVSTWLAMAVFATVRPSVAGATWEVSASLYNGAQEQQPVSVSYRDGNARVLMLGLFFGAYPGDLANQIIINAARTVGTGNLDIDSVYFLRCDLPAYIISPRTSEGLGMRRWGGLPGRPAFIDPRDATGRQSLVSQVFYAAGGDLGLILDGAYDYNGDVFITSSGTGLSFCVIEDGTYPTAGVNTAWRQGDNTGPSYTPWKDTVVATRYPAALTPQ